MRYLLFLLLPLFLLSKPFKVASYNVENLFDASYQGTEYEEYIPGKHNWNARMVEIKLNHTAEVICDLDADILGLQEVENSGVLSALQKKLKTVGCAYPYSTITSKNGAVIQVALLSRYPIKKQADIVVSQSPRVRNILEADVEVEGHSLKLFVNHWKSKAYRGYESKRIKYAKALQARITKLASHQAYIVLGDFNSDHNAYLTLDEKNNDTQGKTAFSDVLQTKVEEHEMLKAERGKHYTLWKELAIEQRWSHKFYGKKSSLDQIVLPQTMFDKKGIDYVNNSFKVFKASYLFTKRGYINRWRYKNGKHQAKGYSDHLPVYAYFDTKAYASEKYQKTLRETKPIEYFYEVETLKSQIELKNVLVILKRGRNAIIKQSTSGRGVMLFGSADKLEEGHRYDLLVEAIKTYHGLKEVTHAYVLKKRGQSSTKSFNKHSKDLFVKDVKQNEVIRGVEGVYKNRYLYTQGNKIPIYFKKKKLTPKNGSKLKIDYAHLGYYKKLQLVIYSKKDFTILEN